MSLTEYQRSVCRLLAAERVARGERYVAGGAALNEILASPRVSHDVDLFHDTREAVLGSWEQDREQLIRAGHHVQALREFPTFVEAEVTKGAEGVILQWVQDSAFRFFPLVEHPDFGLALHPFDLATNKTLALVGRAEIRDWFDIISCHTQLQPFGCLVWATCGKDPGLNPGFILEQASRSAHYTALDYETLAFHGKAPAMADLGRAIDLDPSMASAFERRGFLLLREGRVREAASDFTSALALDPGWPEALWGRARALLKMGQPGLAMDDLSRALEGMPRSAAMLNDRGECRRRLGDVAAALEDFRLASDIDPGLPVAAENECLLLKDLGRLVEARERLTRALKARPEEERLLALEKNLGPLPATNRRRQGE